MDFKNYISALFYLREAQRYSSPVLTAQIQQNIHDLNEEAYAATGNVCFKLYNDLRDEFPDLDFSQGPKESFKKTSVTLSIRRPLSEEEASRHPLAEFSSVEIHTSQLCILGGDVEISTRVISRWSTEPSDLYLSLEFMKIKPYQDATELERLKQQIRLALVA